MAITTWLGRQMTKEYNIGRTFLIQLFLVVLQHRELRFSRALPEMARRWCQLNTIIIFQSLHLKNLFPILYSPHILVSEAKRIKVVPALGAKISEDEMLALHCKKSAVSPSNSALTEL